MHSAEINIPEIALPSPESLPVVSGDDARLAENIGHYVLIEGGTIFYRAEKYVPVIDVETPGDVITTAMEQVGSIANLRGFSLETELNTERLGGPIVEIAGPTAAGYDIIRNLGTVPERVEVSNISDESYLEGVPLSTLVGRKLDYFADANNLWHDDESVGAILTASNDNPDREKMFSEFRRVLRPNGLFVAQAIGVNDLRKIVAAGLTPQALQVDTVIQSDQRELVRLSGVFKKQS